MSLDSNSARKRAGRLEGLAALAGYLSAGLLVGWGFSALGAPPSVVNGVRTLLIVMVIVAIGSWLYAKYLNFQAKKLKKDEQKRSLDASVAQQHADEQTQLAATLARLNSQSLSMNNELPRLLLEAAQNLRQATIDFSEHAYSPYWQSIENAANFLAQFDGNVNQIAGNADSYQCTADQYEGPVEPFAVSSISVEHLKVADEVARKMQEIVRVAQRDYQFASIFEQRKTNSLLTSGFKNLGDAISRMSSEINSSIRGLDSSVSGLHTRIDRGMNEAALSAERRHSQTMQTASASAQRERQMVRELDAVRNELKYGFR